MRLYLGSADLTAGRSWLPTGLYHGVTTNPPTLKRDGVPCRVAEVGLLAREGGPGKSGVAFSAGADRVIRIPSISVTPRRALGVPPIPGTRTGSSSLRSKKFLRYYGIFRNSCHTNSGQSVMK